MKLDLEKEFDLVLSDCKKILLSKSHDYASDNDLFKNFSISRFINLDPRKGLLVRILDKISRINNFIESKDLKNESVDDSIKDIINYLFILHCLNNTKD